MLINNFFLKIFTLVTFLIMVFVNALANILPINGINTGQISDSYPNLFAPIGSTFSIWGLIYLLLFIYSLYQFFPKSIKIENIFNKINIYFIFSSILNSLWIFSWHYKLISLSVILMLLILYSLIKISKITNEKNIDFKNRVFVKICFGIHFSWITIATIANITTLLVSLGWNNFIFSDELWMIIILFIGTLIASTTTIKEKNIAYGLVPIWAYYGIYSKHVSILYFNNLYPNIIISTVICIVIFILVNSYLIKEKKTF